jgi:hypothetical protein
VESLFALCSLLSVFSSTLLALCTKLFAFCLCTALRALRSLTPPYSSPYQGEAGWGRSPLFAITNIDEKKNKICHRVKRIKDSTN